MPVDLCEKSGEKATDARQPNSILGQPSTKNRDAHAVIFPAPLFSRIWNRLSVCPWVYWLIHPFTALGRVWNWLRYALAGCSNRKRDKHGMEGVPLHVNTPLLQACLQVFDSFKRGAVWNQKRNPCSPGQQRTKARKIFKSCPAALNKEVFMPIVAIQPNTRRSFPYTVPASGKVKIGVEASLPVDIFVVKKGDEAFTASPELIRQHGIYMLPQRKIETQTLTLPETWRAIHWVLIIANPSNEVAAVYYTVFTA
jgi:hypothetical protein